MIVQSVDNIWYNNPVLGGSNWYLWWPEMEDMARLAIIGKNKAELRKEVNNLIKGWGKISKNEKPYKDERPFPTTWIKVYSCYVFQIEILGCIYDEMIIGFDTKHTQEFIDVLVQNDGRLRTGVLGWKWRFSVEEIKKLYSGENKSFLFWGASKNKIQSHIRTQLGIKNISELTSSKGSGLVAQKMDQNILIHK